MYINNTAPGSIMIDNNDDLDDVNDDEDIEHTDTVLDPWDPYEDDATIDDDED